MHNITIPCMGRVLCKFSVGWSSAFPQELHLHNLGNKALQDPPPHPLHPHSPRHFFLYADKSMMSNYIALDAFFTMKTVMGTH